MNDSVTVRKIGKDEIKTIVRLANETWPPTYRYILSSIQIDYMMKLFYTEASLEEQMTEKQHQFIVAETEGEPVGFAAYAPGTKQRQYKLHKIYVHPHAQGKGIGKALIDYILADLKTQRAQTLLLNVNRSNKAKHFYEKLGFRVLGEENIDIGSGYFMNDYIMSKDLED